MGPLEIAGNQDAPPGDLWEGPWWHLKQNRNRLLIVLAWLQWQWRQMMRDMDQSRWHTNEVQDNGQGEGHSFLRAAGPWYKACKGSCPMLQPLIPQDLMPQQLYPDHIYSRTCPSKSGPFCSCINLWSELNLLRQKDYTIIAVIKSLSQLAAGRWGGSLVVMQLSSNNPALSGPHIHLKKPLICTRHAIVLISSIGFIYVLNISGNFFLLPWGCQRHPVHHFECEDLIPATVCVASGHWGAEQQCGLINWVPVTISSWVPLNKHSPAASCAVMHLDLLLLYNKWEIKSKQEGKGFIELLYCDYCFHWHFLWLLTLPDAKALVSLQLSCGFLWSTRAVMWYLWIWYHG